MQVHGEWASGRNTYLSLQDVTPGVKHHHRDDATAHDHRHQEDHHHTQLNRHTHTQRSNASLTHCMYEYSTPGICFSRFVLNCISFLEAVMSFFFLHTGQIGRFDWTDHHNDEHGASQHARHSCPLWKVGLLHPCDRVWLHHSGHGCKLRPRTLLMEHTGITSCRWLTCAFTCRFLKGLPFQTGYNTPKKPNRTAWLYWRSKQTKEGWWDLLFVELHAVPVMSQGDHLSLPVFQEADGPEGHEYAEEDCSRVVK